MYVKLQAVEETLTAKIESEITLLKERSNKLVANIEREIFTQFEFGNWRP